MQRRSLLLAAGLAAPAVAQGAWPTARPIEVIIPFPAGGGVDQMGRLISQHLPQHLPGARTLVTNRPGAGGQIGFEMLFNAAPDGYMIGVATNSAMHAIAIERRPRYRPDEFTLLANVVDDPGAFWVTARSPWRTLEDLRMAARGRPGEIGVGTAGVGSDDHMLLRAFEVAAGITLLHVPYGGTSPVQRALLAGTIPIGAFNGSDALNLLRDGRIRGLAQGGPNRWAPLGPIPTFREAGFDVLGGTSLGVVAPPGLHQEITVQYELAFTTMLADAEFLRDAAAQGFPVRPLVGRAYRQMMAADFAVLRTLWERRPWRE